MLGHNNLKKSSVIAFLAVLLLLTMAMFTPHGSITAKSGYWYSLAPPLLAIALVMLTQRLIFSLLVGVLAGGLLVVLPEQGITAIGSGVITGPLYILQSVSNPSNLRILFFITCMLMMISVIVTSGGFQAIVRWLKQYATDPYSSKLITALMGLVIFIDDYANTLIIGNAMRPVTDQQKISREKLAFLVDSTSAPIAGLAFISSWIGYEVGLFSELSKSLAINKNGYAIFLDALGYRFYCILLIIFVFTHILLKRDFGPMLKAEQRARLTGALEDKNARPLQAAVFISQKAAPEAREKAITAIVPISGLVACLISLLFVTGNGPALVGQGHSVFSLNTWQIIVTAIPNTTILLACSGLLGLVLACCFARFYSKVSSKSIGKALLAGVKTSLLPLSILILAWSLKQSVDALHTGQYIISVAGDSITPQFFPAIIFAIACVTAFTIGTSFGTMGIILPVAIPLAYQLDGSTYGLLTIISMAAVLDGAIFGDHCSPLSDTTIMSSVSTSCDHIHHVKTQAPYAITVGMIAIVCGYLPAAAGLSNLWCLLLGATAIMTTLLIIGRQIQTPASPNQATT